MRPSLALLLLALLVGGAIVVARPSIHRETLRSDLEVAASDFSTCMLGARTTAIAWTLHATREAYRQAKDDTWPMRCAPLAKRAMEAAAAGGMKMEVGWDEIPKSLADGGTDPSIELLEHLAPYWTNESAIPRPRSPIHAALDNARPLTDVLVRDFTSRVVSDFVLVEAPHGSCRLDLEGATCTWEPESLEDLEYELGAERLAWRAGTSDLVRRDGSVAVRFPSWFAMRWGKTYANGRIVVVSSDGDLLEHSNGKTVRGMTFPLRQRSTRFLNGWALYKDTSGQGDARIMALNLADGVAAKPIVIGTTRRPSWHSYDSCEADSLFVDMDPNILVFEAGSWSMLSMPSSFHRIACSGTHAFVTSDHVTERCDRRGCTRVAFDPFAPEGLGLALGGVAPDIIAATDDRAFRIRRDDPMWMLDVASPSSPTRTITLAESSTARPDAIHIVRGQAIVILRTVLDDHVIAAVIGSDGLVRTLTAQ